MAERVQTVLVLGEGSSDFYTDPAPAIAMKSPGRRWHCGKVAFELKVMRRWL
ncbi:MAG TPA: hypothetical protein PLB21_10265 [Actinomycetota bacterium]|nr:hypothetical protein [Actinomycetota bacterium]